MIYSILYNIQDYYLVVYRSKDVLDLSKQSTDEHIFIHKEKINDDDYLNQAIFKSNDKKGLKRVDLNGHILIIKTGYLSFLIRPYLCLVMRKEATAFLANYRLNVRIELIEKLSKKNSCIADFLNAYKCYTYHNDYSLWVFNKETKVFTHVASSEPPTREYVEFSESSSLNVATEEDFEVEYRQPVDSDIVLFKEKGMKSVTRVSVTLGPHKQPGILALYSKLEGFTIQDAIISDIQSLIEMKYLDSIIGAQQGLENITKSLVEAGASDLENYFHTLTKCLCEDLEYEAASVLVVEGDHLVLASTYDKETKGKPKEKITYAKGENCLTNLVKDNPGYMHVEYDLSTSKYTANVYNEVTEHKSKNWIGVPVVCEGDVIFIFRVVNKYRIENKNGKVIIAPRPSDYLNLRAIWSTVESQVSNAMKFKELNESLEVHDNFAKVYRHEIRSPASAIVTAPNLIVEKLQKPNFNERDKEEIIQKLYDMEMLAKNLHFISRTYNIEAMISEPREGKNLSLLKDIIMPIHKINRRYYEIKYDSELIIDHDSMRGAHIYGEKELYSIVFYALLDNAGKYQEDEGGYIKISAEYGPKSDFIFVYIENAGLEINHDEVEYIFSSHGRGVNARECSIDGSGIGLWLCKKILTKHGGEIVLESRFSPVRFKLTIPMGDV